MFIELIVELVVLVGEIVIEDFFDFVIGFRRRLVIKTRSRIELKHLFLLLQNNWRNFDESISLRRLLVVLRRFFTFRLDNARPRFRRFQPQGARRFVQGSDHLERRLDCARARF